MIVKSNCVAVHFNRRFVIYVTRELWYAQPLQILCTTDPSYMELTIHIYSYLPKSRNMDID